MRSQIDNVFERRYESLVSKFINDIQGVNPNGIPEPFLPVYGKGYEQSKIRLAFVGMETKGWGYLTDFLNEVQNGGAKSVLFRTEEEFDDFKFTNWGNNYGSGFWDFVFDFLAKFHGIENWKSVKGKEYPEILKT